MGKTAKLKTTPKRTYRQSILDDSEPTSYKYKPPNSAQSVASIRSRTARRNETSAPPNPGKISEATHPSTTSSTFLGPHIPSSISKRRSKQKPLKRKQRLRLEAGKEKADIVREKTEMKVLGSLGREDVRNRRRRKWEEIDDGIGKEVGEGLRRGKRANVGGKKRNGVPVLTGNRDEDGRTDEEMVEAEEAENEKQGTPILNGMKPRRGEKTRIATKVEAEEINDVPL